MSHPTDAPDLATLAVRIAAIDDWLHHPPRVDPNADGLSGDVERERAISARRDERADLQRQLDAGTAKRTADLRALAAETRRQGLDPDTVAAMVRRITAGRTDSRGGMTRPERGQMLRELGARARGQRRGGPGRGIRAGAMDRTAMLKRVDELLRTPDEREGRTPDLDAPGLPRAYAEAILCRQRGLPKGTECPLEMATDPELRGLIAALYRRAHPTAPRRRAD